MEKTRLLGRHNLSENWLMLRIDRCPESGRLVVAAVIDGQTLPIYHSHQQESWSALLLPPNQAPHWQEVKLHTELDWQGWRYADNAPPQPNVIVAVESGIGPAMHRCLNQAFNGALLIVGDALPFRPAPSQIMLPDLPPHVLAAVPQAEAAGIPSRIASDRPGCWDGPIADLLAPLQQRFGQDVLIIGPPDHIADYQSWQNATLIATHP